MAGPGGGGGGDAAGDVIVVLDDDEEEEAAEAAAAAATPSAPPEAAAERPAPPAALPAENGRLFAEFVAFCSQHTREHPDVMPYLASRHQKSSPEFLASAEFRNVLGRCLTRVQAQRSKVYVYINELCTVLKAHSQKRKKLQPQPLPPSASPPAAPSDPSEQESSRPPRGGGGGSKRQIRYLENLLKLHAEEIRRLQAQELDLEALDRADSAYLQESRLKRRMMRIFQRLCELKDCGTLTGRVIEQRIPYRGTRYPEVNRRIERLINRPEAFPDYNDILKVVQKANARHSLGLPRQQMASMATSAFQEVGERLQERRRLDLIYNFGSYLTDEYRRENDPALADEDLARRLRRNREEAVERLDQVLVRYVDLQAKSEEGGWRLPQAGPSTGPPQAEPDPAVAAGESGSGPERTQGEASPPDCEEEEEEDDDSLSSETDLEAELEKSLEGGEEEEEEEEESLAPDPEDPPPAEADQSMGLKEPELLLDSSADEEEEEEEEEEEGDGEEERGGQREEAGEQPLPPAPKPPGALPAVRSPPSQQFLLEIEAALPLEASETPPPSPQLPAPSPPLRPAEHRGSLPPSGPERKPQPPLKHSRALENGRAVNGQPPSKRGRRGLAVPRSCIEVLSAGSSEEDGEGLPSPLSPPSPVPTADSPGLGLVTSSSQGSPSPESLVQVCKASVATQCDPEEVIVLSD
ncbi:hypothetical protein lerEdw1_015916 [Lerista edwardsae]|nr:hypothetical protein lerEdw1_015916 [Lerista edwardsae]